MRLIYLDHNATTPLLPEVAAALAAAQAAGYANPASQHAPGRQARHALEEAREGIAALLGVDLTSRRPDKLLFTSGGTEANNLAIFGLAAAVAATGDATRQLITSPIEHPSVAGPANELTRRGWHVRHLQVSLQGHVEAEELRDLLTDQTRLVSVMLANNETGVLQPITELAEICAQHGVPLHTDAVQVAGKLPLDFAALGASTMSIAAHKFHGPVGIGALAVRHGVEIEPELHGGFHQHALRPGTENVALAVAMHAALTAFAAEATERATRMRRLRDRLEAGLRAGFSGLVVNGLPQSAIALPTTDETRLPHTSNLALVGCDRQALAMALDLAGVACSTGSACASGSSEPSTVLTAMRCPDEVVASSLRFSLGAMTTEEEIDEAVRRILDVALRLRGGSTK